MDPEIAKVSVEKFGSENIPNVSDRQILYAFEKNLGLFENVKRICKKVGLPENVHIYGLKFLPTKDNPSTGYISEVNYKTIKHNDNLKVVFSIEYMTDRIVTNLLDDMLRSLSFKNLNELCFDPVFIEELVKEDKHKKVIDCYINQDDLLPEEQLPLLKTILHLLQKQYIKNTCQDFLQKTLDLIKSPETTFEETKFALNILQRILATKNREFTDWKKKIIEALPLSEITPFIWKEPEKCNTHVPRDLQYSALQLINHVIAVCRGQKKQSLIRDINQRKSKIFDFIIKDGNLDKAMEHELYVLQTYILSTYAEALKPHINIHNELEFKKDEFELSNQDMKRVTILMDFDEQQNKNKRISVESVLSGRWDNSELSLDSIAANFDDYSSNRSSIESSSVTLRKRRISEQFNDNSMKLSTLTVECLRHYKNHHFTTFRQSQIEEYLYEPGIFITSERIVQLLAKILHIGQDPPDAKSTFYQPLAFFCTPSCSPNTPFFWEIFAITMWLMSRTRKEMKASTFDDYAKVMTVIEKQVKSVLKLKPQTIKSLTTELLHTSFQTVLKQIQEEKEENFKKLIETHSSILELKEKLVEENKKHVFEHRMNCLLHGEYFPKIQEKKRSGGQIFVKLCQNMKDIMVFEGEADKLEFIEKYRIEDISHVVTGRNCKHANLSSGEPNLAFSIFVNNEETIRFIANDQRTTSYWVDALHLLTGKQKLSEEYTNELKDLVEMDLRLRLMDLQNVELPKVAPEIPPLPDELVPPSPSPRRSRKLINSK